MATRAEDLIRRHRDRVEEYQRMGEAGVFRADDEALAGQACEGWLRYGRGRHPARLDFGDCFAYALARERAEPLLSKGEGFSRTDVLAAP